MSLLSRMFAALSECVLLLQEGRAGVKRGERRGENELETVTKVCLRSSSVVNFAGVCCRYVRSRDTVGTVGGEEWGEGGEPLSWLVLLLRVLKSIQLICVLHTFERTAGISRRFLVLRSKVCSANIY